MNNRWSGIVLQQLKSTSLQVLLGSLGCATVVYLMVQSSNLPYMNEWITSFYCTTTIIFLNFFNLTRFERFRSMSDDKKANIYWATLFLGWSHWAFIGAYIFPMCLPDQAVFVAIVIAGLAAGTVPVYIASPRIMRSAILCILVPFAFGAYISQQTYSHLLAAITLVYVLVLLRSGVQLHEILISQYMYSEQNERLVKVLNDKNVDIVSNAKRAMMGDVASGMAHEMNNPLTTILLHLELMEMGLDAPKPDPVRLKETVASIKSNLLRIVDITKKLSYFYNTQKSNTFTARSVNQIITESVRANSEDMNRYNITLHLDDTVAMMAHCNPEELLQAFNHIIKNAIEACRFETGERWIRISTGVNDGHLEIRISDSGHGIPRQIQDKIMHPFFSTKEVGKGLGLGLSIANSIVRNHKGTLRLEPDSQHTMFIIELPAQSKLIQAQPELESKSQPTQTA